MTIQTESWGSWEVLRIFSDEMQCGFSLVPARGGCLTELVLTGKSVLDGYQNAAELETLEWGKSALLAPFPNRLRDGHYEWAGKTYQFPVNEKDRNNALHGFVMDQPFEVTRHVLGSTTAFVELTYTYDGSRPYYPFPFNIRISYELNGLRHFYARFELENTGTTAMPAGLGWHPYFRTGTSIDQASLWLPPADRILVDDRMIPTGQREPLQDFLDLAPIAGAHFDTCFALREAGATHVQLEQGDVKLRYSQSGEFPFLQVFIPPARQSIALEPMTCNVDAFHNGEGLQKLAPGERLGGSVGIALATPALRD
jgi:aldose 1-epimerase